MHRSSGSHVAITIMYLLLLAACAPSRAAARRLRQHTDSVSGPGLDKSHLIYVSTVFAAALSAARPRAIAHNDASMFVSSATTYMNKPPGMSKASTGHSEGDVLLENGAVETGAVAMRTVAFAINDRGAESAGAQAIVDGMPQAAPISRRAQKAHYGADAESARGNTISVFEPTPVNEVITKKRIQVTSVGVPLPAPKSFAMSDAGDGPLAISMAGQAVSSAYSGTDKDVIPYPAGTRGAPPPSPHPDALPAPPITAHYGEQLKARRHAAQRQLELEKRREARLRQREQARLADDDA